MEDKFGRRYPLSMKLEFRQFKGLHEDYVLPFAFACS